MEQIKTPIAFIIFNRPQTTEVVFAEIARAMPPKLLVIADGPRADRPDDVAKCSATRAIIDRVNWDCEVITNYADTNLGCKQRVSSGLNWVFNSVAEAIVLEDDCLPHPTFFHFCSELLDHYRDDPRIMHISGDNFQLGQRCVSASYYFSRYSHIWGWATWRRAWKFYDVEMKLWQEFRDKQWLNDILADPGVTAYWSRFFQSTYEGKIDTWDVQWMFACWAQNGLSILPCVNLISNIGAGLEATHMADKSWFAHLPASAMRFPLQHPAQITRDLAADTFTQHTMFIGTSLYERFRGRIKRELRRLHLA